MMLKYALTTSVGYWPVCRVMLNNFATAPGINTNNQINVTLTGKSRGDCRPV